MGMTAASCDDFGKLWGQQRDGKPEDIENKMQENTADKMPREMLWEKYWKEKWNKIGTKQRREILKQKQMFTSGTTIPLHALMCHPLLMPSRSVFKGRMCAHFRVQTRPLRTIIFDVHTNSFKSGINRFFFLLLSGLCHPLNREKEIIACVSAVTWQGFPVVFAKLSIDAYPRYRGVSSKATRLRQRKSLRCNDR